MADRLEFNTVVERLAAAGPRQIMGPHCWFCGKVEAWFSCDCKKAREAQKDRDLGKREGYPRFNVRLNCIENLDEETIRFNEGLGFKRLVPPEIIALAVHAEPEAVDTVDTPAVDVEPESVHANETASLSVDTVHDTKAARKAYKAAHERQRRAKQKEGA